MSTPKRPGTVSHDLGENCDALEAYRRRSPTGPVGLFDAGRREVLSFRVSPVDFLTLVSETELSLEVGGASVRLKDQRMETLRALAHRLKLKPVTESGR